MGAGAFTARGKTVKKNGWKEGYANNFDDSEENDVLDQQLPDLKPGYVLKGQNGTRTAGQTKPPARFTEATLWSAMEDPSKCVEVHDRKLKETLQSTGGLGTVATRADIIDKLFNSFTVERQGQQIRITSKGRQLLDLV